jgi:hypothetical protein
MVLAILQITPWGGVGPNWAAGGLGREKRREARVGLRPNREEGGFSIFPNLFSNSFWCFGICLKMRMFLKLKNIHGLHNIYRSSMYFGLIQIFKAFEIRERFKQTLGFSNYFLMQFS